MEDLTMKDLLRFNPKVPLLQLTTAKLHVKLGRFKSLNYHGQKIKATNMILINVDLSRVRHITNLAHERINAFDKYPTDPRYHIKMRNYNTFKRYPSHCPHLASEKVRPRVRPPQDPRAEELEKQ